MYCIVSRIAGGRRYYWLRRARRLKGRTLPVPVNFNLGRMDAGRFAGYVLTAMFFGDTQNRDLLAEQAKPKDLRERLRQKSALHRELIDRMETWESDLNFQGRSVADALAWFKSLRRFIMTFAELTAQQRRIVRKLHGGIEALEWKGRERRKAITAIAGNIRILEAAQRRERDAKRRKALAFYDA